MVARVSVPNQTIFFEGNSPRHCCQGLAYLIEKIQNFVLRILQTILPCWFKLEPHALNASTPQANARGEIAAPLAQENTQQPQVPQQPFENLHESFEHLTETLREEREETERMLERLAENRRLLAEASQSVQELEQRVQEFIAANENGRIPTAPNDISTLLEEHLDRCKHLGEGDPLPPLPQAVLDFFNAQ